MANGGVRPQAALLNQKINLCSKANVEAVVRCMDKNSIRAQVQDSGDVIAAIAMPTDPNFVRGLDAG